MAGRAARRSLDVRPRPSPSAALLLPYRDNRRARSRAGGGKAVRRSAAPTAEWCQILQGGRRACGRPSRRSGRPGHPRGAAAAIPCRAGRRRCSPRIGLRRGVRPDRRRGRAAEVPHRGGRKRSGPRTGHRCGARHHALRRGGAGCNGWTMQDWSDNIEAVACALCAKRLAHGDTRNSLAADVDLWWNLTAAELECGVMDGTGEYVLGQIDWMRKIAGYCDWMRPPSGEPRGLGDRPVRSAVTSRLRYAGTHWRTPEARRVERGRWSRPARPSGRAGRAVRERVWRMRFW